MYKDKNNINKRHMAKHKKKVLVLVCVGVLVAGFGVAGAVEIPVTPEATTASACECSDWGEWEWQNSICGGSICSSSQRLQSQMRTCAPLGCDVSIDTRCIDDSSCIVDGIETIPGIETVTGVNKEGTDTEEDIELEGTLLDDTDTLSSESGLRTVVILLALVVIVETAVIISMTSKKKKKESETQNQIQHPHQ